MDGELNDPIIKHAESETLGHLRFMRKSIQIDLLFTFMLMVALVANELTAIAMGLSPTRWDEIKLFLSPPPMLFFALAISAVIETYLLMRLKKGLKELSGYVLSPGGSLDVKVGKSVTDINYAIVKAMERSMRIWPVVAFLFVLYFAESLRNIAEWTLGTIPDLTFNWTALLNTVVLFMSIIFFWIQTKRWLARRKHLRRLKRMEMTVVEELRI
jgi:hypothetical protein